MKEMQAMAALVIFFIFLDSKLPAGHTRLLYPSLSRWSLGPSAWRSHPVTICRMKAGYRGLNFLPRRVFSRRRVEALHFFLPREVSSRPKAEGLWRWQGRHICFGDGLFFVCCCY